MGGEFKPLSEVIHFNYLLNEQVQLLEATTSLRGDELQQTARRQTLVIFNTITYPQNVRSIIHQEKKRADEVLGVWHVENGCVYAEGFGTPEQVFERTRIHFPQEYNEREAKTALMGFHMLANGKAEEVKYPMFHPNGTRYVVGLKRVGNEIVNVSVDVGKFGRDLSPIESGDVVRLLHDRHKEDTIIVNHDEEFPLLVVKHNTSSISTQEVQQTAVARSLISEVDISKKHSSIFADKLAPVTDSSQYRFDSPNSQNARETLPVARDVHSESRPVIGVLKRTFQEQERRSSKLVYSPQEEVNPRYTVLPIQKSDAKETVTVRLTQKSMRSTAIEKRVIDMTVSSSSKSLLSRVWQKLAGKKDHGYALQEGLPHQHHVEAKSRLDQQWSRRGVPNHPPPPLKGAELRVTKQFERGLRAVKQVGEKISKSSQNVKRFTRQKVERWSRLMKKVVNRSQTELKGAYRRLTRAVDRVGSGADTLLHTSQQLIQRVRERWLAKKQQSYEKIQQVKRLSLSTQETPKVLKSNFSNIKEQVKNLRYTIKESGTRVRRWLQILIALTLASVDGKPLEAFEPETLAQPRKKESLPVSLVKRLSMMRFRLLIRKKEERPFSNLADLRRRVVEKININVFTIRERHRLRRKFIVSKRRELQRSTVSTSRANRSVTVPAGVERRAFPYHLGSWLLQFWHKERVIFDSANLRVAEVFPKETTKSNAKQNLPMLNHLWIVFQRWLRWKLELKFDRPQGLAFGQPKTRTLKRRIVGTIYERWWAGRSGSVVVA